MVDVDQRQRTIFSTPFDNARENYINENYITNYLDRHNQQQETWENLEGPGHRILGPAAPWNPFGGTVGPNAYPEINENWIPGVNNYLKPSWLEAKNKTYGLPGTEVAQSKWKEKFRSIIDMIMNRESLNERDAKKYIFDNYGLTV